MSTEHLPDWFAFEAYFAGTATPEERATIDQWIAAAPDRRAYVERLRTIAAQRGHRTFPSYGAAAATENVLDRIRRDEGNVEIHRRLQTGRAWRPAVARWGVPLALVVIAVAGLWAGSASTRSDDPRTYTTKIAERIAVRLPDGTRIRLAPKTQLVVASGFGTTTRTVTLTGEADFSVSAAQGIPFVVRTGPVSVRVLGTAFNVRRYGSDAEVHVAVRSGRVLTGTPASSRVVSAGFAAHVTDSNTVVEALSVAGQDTDWDQGQLVFRATPVPVFLATLERWYGYRFVLSDSALARERVSLRVSVADSAGMLAALRWLLEVETRIEGASVVLVPRHGKEPTGVRRYRTEQFKPEMEMGR